MSTNGVKMIQQKQRGDFFFGIEAIIWSKKKSGDAWKKEKEVFTKEQGSRQFEEIEKRNQWLNSVIFNKKKKTQTKFNVS